jgi:hypothetical protein
MRVGAAVPLCERENVRELGRGRIDMGEMTQETHEMGEKESVFPS